MSASVTVKLQDKTKSIPIELRQNSTVFLETITKEFGVTPNDVRALCGPKQIQVNHDLSEYGIGEGAVINLILRNRGGF
ncbi:hypothetical protein TVAG_141970 [Trichomonas vaginalis G3]|uniref:Ubiquitin-like domain-containing protein n=1 Tax=Trichomonas vaginalis (strain ATCC PRA-98 / G3) TaxID=412133 RepID=A2FWR0_TRIV3|nr:ubiquitin-like family [Trichomonas vaginalis G3]EAX90653.1 hypothetical protein TVAG_141970 [Trichomonas vaginalis G3]KAI5553841.1 ubiquitin-like family [Trichomonas vaginalis G3]|eukprot:XP_001303583.1 hypothetical protein [Trichomonas vaginalis G3]